MIISVFVQCIIGQGTVKIKITRNMYIAVFSRVPRYVPWYTTTVLNFGHCEIASSSGHLVDMPTSDGVCLNYLNYLC